MRAAARSDPLVCAQPREIAGWHLQLVLSVRADNPPHLPSLNKWQHRQCANCCKKQTTGA